MYMQNIYYIFIFEHRYEDLKIDANNLLNSLRYINVF